MPEKMMHLNLFVKVVGHHEAAWRQPDSNSARLWDLSAFQEIARIAERGKLDSLFFSDSPALHEPIKGIVAGQLDPTILLAALTSTTERIGLIATASTSYEQPFNVARRFATIDHLSKGRAGWNIVTTWNGTAPANFGFDTLIDHSERYARAREFVDICMQLWDSWEDDAIRNDRDADIYVDTAKLHHINHEGLRYRVRGPLNVPRPPQGYPVLVQAGSSEDGKDFASTYAEAIFTAQPEFEVAQSFAQEVKVRAAAKGRNPEKVLILPGFSPIIASTEGEAKQFEADLLELSSIEVGLANLSRRLDGFDLTPYPLDGPLPDELLKREQTQGAQARADLILDLAREKHLTIRQILQRLVVRGHKGFAGTPEQAADEMERWFRAGAADGFNLMPPATPGCFETFVDHVVPELQRRGLFRKEYEGSTLREHYGLDRPANQYAPAGNVAV